MSNEHELPTGYRFSPTEEELVSFYLRNKLKKIREDAIQWVIPVASNIYCLDPWQLPEISGKPCNMPNSEEWFFFCPRQSREAHGGRPTRTTPSGYWKATGSTGPVYSSTNQARVIGLKKTMVFYKGRAPTGTKTKWKMNEYKALDEAESITPYSAPQVYRGVMLLRNEFSLCRVYKNSGCLRAFDRRPSITATTSENPIAREEPMNNGQNHCGAKRARSEDSSSSDENGRSPASLQEDAVDLKMLEEFDWNQLDWI